MDSAPAVGRRHVAAPDEKWGRAFGLGRGPGGSDAGSRARGRSCIRRGRVMAIPTVIGARPTKAWAELRDASDAARSRVELDKPMDSAPAVERDRDTADEGLARVFWRSAIELRHLAAPAGLEPATSSLWAMDSEPAVGRVSNGRGGEGWPEFCPPIGHRPGSKIGAIGVEPMDSEPAAAAAVIQWRTAREGTTKQSTRALPYPLGDARTIREDGRAIGFEPISMDSSQAVAPSNTGQGRPGEGSPRIDLSISRPPVPAVGCPTARPSARDLISGRLGTLTSRLPGVATLGPSRWIPDGQSGRFRAPQRRVGRTAF